MLSQARRGWWGWAVSLAVTVMALGIWGVLACPAAVADEGGYEPKPKIEDPGWTLYWQTYDVPVDDPNIPIDSHPAVPANTGCRIFPGKKTYNDEHADKRRLVLAVIEWTEEPPEDTKMWFRLWDVDDPSANGPPIDTKPAADPGMNGPDNADESWAMAGTSQNGMISVKVGKILRFSGEEEIADPEEKKKICKVAVRVGMQPGDNWRFCGAREENENALRGMTQDQADKVQPPGGVNESDMLTAWRKVHIEADCMQEDDAEEPSNLLSDTVKDAEYDGTTNTDLKVVNVPGSSIGPPLFGPHDWDEDDTFNNGYIKVQDEGTSPWQVVDFDSVMGDDHVFVAGDHESANGKAYWLGDDDYEVDGEDNLKMKVTYPKDAACPTQIATFLAYAYIKPEYYYDTEDGNITFERNTTNYSGLADKDWNFKNDRGTSFWTIHLVSAHQPQSDKDGEPDDEAGGLGTSSLSKCIVYQEVIRDCGAIEWLVVLHEIGHGLGAEDLENTPVEDGTMHEAYQADYVGFVPQSLYEIREEDHAE